ncbi:helix-turn-helix transcriptional regulator [Micromonospora auratinigra]|uniref:Transcriptional regulator, XRE family n=1 Tax=Micromonospora auratinigra TaxID=261654 RepID=A0A1A8ZPS8_9ACTN|nr:helix-turn-helix transcriptional regulator [Micromonospora auratinigra]SBT45874.1 transcriptional regulator, XRE family [Micromonospora auratinigra]
MVERPRSGLGEFLRSRRARLSPAAVGLPDRGRRRTPGLRREEVAELAGIGIDWYVRLEQGRDVSPSDATVEALADALRLDPAEHAHLRALAGQRERPPSAPETVPDGVRRLLDSLAQPAYVTGRRWDLLAWNAAAADLFPGLVGLSPADRNSLVYLFLTADARRLFGTGWADDARRLLAKFRVAHDLHPGDPGFAELTSRLRAASPEFAGWWDRHDIDQGGGGRKTLHHPRRGTREYAYTTLHPTEAPGLKLAVYTPA